MRKAKKAGPHRVFWGVIYIGIFVAAFLISAVFKMTYTPWGKEFTVDWNDSVGKTYTNLSYGENEANKFDLYVPADSSKERYGLIVYLHAGGFTTGDKSDDADMLKWLSSKGYVTAGINYTLRDDSHPEASVYSQSMEIKESMPYVIAEAKKLGYEIDEMAISGGSAGGSLALLYAYRDADTSPVPVKMVFEAVGPSSFYPEDWDSYGFDKAENSEAAAGLFSAMAGKTISADTFRTEDYDEAIKDISALLWVDENTVPTLMAYGKHDKFQSFKASVRLDEALTNYNVPHDYIVLEHSGHGLQNDNDKFIEYMRKISEYLDAYMPVE